ncbi:MAG: CsgG/HfaB family protein [Nitrososphaerales archaeon]
MIATTLIVVLSGCASMPEANVGGGSIAQLVGPRITENHTPYTAALMCVSNEVRMKNLPMLSISVGEIPDLTGKFSTDGGGGYAVTQGASIMAISALGKSGVVKLVERKDVGVFQFETALADKKVLAESSGENYTLEDGTVINYRPILSGSVFGSDVYMTGGITEINYNIGSGGVEVGAYGASVGGRQYVMNIAADFRVVNSKTLEVVKTLTIQKQVVGYEIRAGLFRFFNVDLVNLDAGSKKDEPVQLAVRALIEDAATQIIGSLYEVPQVAISKCIVEAEKQMSDESMRNPTAVGNRLMHTSAVKE